MTLHVAHDGAGMTVSRVEAVRTTASSSTRATPKRELFAVARSDLFADRARRRGRGRSVGAPRGLRLSGSGSLLLRALAAIVGRLPFRWLRVLGAVLGWLAGSVLRIRRAHVERAMRRAGIADPRREAAGMYQALGTAAFEFLWMAGRRGRARLDDVAEIDPASRPVWDRAFASGRGVVVAASHTGNWDLAACAIAETRPLLVITKHLSARGIDAFWQGARAACGVTLAGAEGAMARGAAHLKQGGAVAMMIDQVPLRAARPLVADFLGAPARLDRAPAALAARAKAPLVVATARRRTQEDGPGAPHVLTVLAVLEPPAHGTSAWIDDASKQASETLAAFVMRYPRDWLWMHRRWVPISSHRFSLKIAKAPAAES